MKRGPLWTCPKCGRPFVKPDHPHSCGDYSVEAFLENKRPDAIALFDRFCELIGGCGPFTFAPAKTRIGFQVRMIFASVNALNQKGMRCHVVLSRRLENPRFDRIEKLGARTYVNHLMIRSHADLDEEVAEWLNESYKVGNQEHLP